MPRIRAALAVAVLTIAAISTLAAGARAQDATRPVWTTPDRFWFRVSVAGGNEWWGVDARNGVRERLFDHRRLAVELSAQSKRDLTALALPFVEPGVAFVVKYDGVQAALEDGLAIEFMLSGDRWRCELNGEWDWGRTPPSDYYCSVLEESPRFIRVPRAQSSSPDDKWEAFIRNDNVGIRQSTGAIQMLSTDGSPAAPYHIGSVRWSVDSRTLSAYRVDADVWRNPTPGIVKAMITRQEWTVR